MSRKDLSFAHGRCQDLLAAASNSQQALRLDFVSAVTIRSFFFLNESAVLQRISIMFQVNLLPLSARFFLSCKTNARVYLAKTGHVPLSS